MAATVFQPLTPAIAKNVQTASISGGGTNSGGGGKRRKRGRRGGRRGSRT